MPSGDSLQEARAWVMGHLDEGVDCPCCGQLARAYRRKLNSAMARDLIWLVKQSGTDRRWVDLHLEAPIELQRSRELAKTAHWGLIEERLSESERGARTSGIWRPTGTGIKFAHGGFAIASHVILYDNQVLGFSNERITIREALAKSFDFDELWKG